MYKISFNIIFVYGLLILDLLINVTDNLISPTIQTFNSIKVVKTINNTVFVIVLVQIFSIICVILNLILHFFQVSDKVREFAWLKLCEKDDRKLLFKPMSQKIALSLVLNKYWWSLLVGFFYLVLTIILQIIRLDSSWHFKQSSTKFLSSSLHLINQDDGTIRNQNIDEMIINSTNNSLLIGASSIMNPTQTTTLNLDLSNIIILIHKLVSTCYYVSFLVVYRSTPNQMINRIFSTKANSTTTSNSFRIDR